VDEISKSPFGQQEGCLPLAIGNIYDSRQARISHGRCTQEDMRIVTVGMDGKSNKQLRACLYISLYARLPFSTLVCLLAMKLH
jgi:hypothetical protein